MKVKKSTLKRTLLAGMAVLAVAMLIAGTVVSASPDVSIWTSSLGEETLEVEGVVVGTFPVYDGGNNITFTWAAYSFPAGVDGSYRVSLWQNTTPLGSEPIYRELHTSHHWRNPDPTTFTFGPFLEFEELCENCPSLIVVQPEAVEAFENDNGDTEYAYSLLGASLSQDGLAALTQSDEILVHGFVKPEPVCTVTPMDCQDGIDNDCDGLVDESGAGPTYECDNN